MPQFITVGPDGNLWFIAFAIATSNVGSAGSITFSADTGGINVPVSLSVCETNSATGACLASGVGVPRGATSVAVTTQ